MIQQFEAFKYWLLSFNGRYPWGEWYLKRTGIALGVNSGWEEDNYLRISFAFFSVYVRMPKILKDNYSYGFVFFERGLHLHYGHEDSRVKVILLPWDWEIHRHRILAPSGRVLYEHVYDKRSKKRNEYDKWMADLDNRRQAVTTCGFTYRPKSPELPVQRRVITCYAEEREWRWRWARWSPRPGMTRRTIDVGFDQPTGERLSSWKGGTTGTSCEWRKGEEFFAALARFEKEINEKGMR